MELFDLKSFFNHIIYSFETLVTNIDASLLTFLETDFVWLTNITFMTEGLFVTTFWIFLKFVFSSNITSSVLLLILVCMVSFPNSLFYLFLCSILELYCVSGTNIFILGLDFMPGTYATWYFSIIKWLYVEPLSFCVRFTSLALFLITLRKNVIISKIINRWIFFL